MLNKIPFWMKKGILRKINKRTRINILLLNLHKYRLLKIRKYYGSK